MNGAHLESELRVLAEHQIWPDTPDVSANVVDHLRAGTRPRGSRNPRVLAWFAAALAMLTTIGAAVSPVRAAIERAIGISGGERVVRVDRVPAGSSLTLGTPMRLPEAERRGHFSAALPLGLGPPNPVWFGGDLAGRAVSLGYGHDTVLTEVPRASVVIAIKMIGPDVRVRRVTIRGSRGLWISHGPRALVLPGAEGVTLRPSVLPGAHVLLWDRPGLALRLETRRPFADAVRIAESVN